jgi:hypothetical protein
LRLPILLSFVLAVVVAPIMAPGSAAAEKKAGVTMPDTLEVAGKKLVLNGMGLREATWLNIDVYVAGLYVEAVSSDAAKLVAAPGPKRLVLKFVRDVDKSDIVKAWSEGFKNNATVELSTIKPLIDRLNGWMGDFEDGDTLTFTYVPTEGVSVDINATRKGTLKGDDFARSLFSIWLGAHPPTKALRNGLLGKH